MSLSSHTNFFRSPGVRWAFSIFAALSVVVFSVVSVVLYESSENAFYQHKSEKVAERIADSIRSAIQNRTRILKIISDSTDLEDSNAFAKAAFNLSSGFSDIYAINLVAADGVIKKVYPEKENKAALGQNLLRRDDVKDYIRAARDANEPQMSHLIMTYQGVSAFVLYVPRYSNRGEFIGWLNAVVDLDEWIRTYALESGLNDTRMVIRWEHPESLRISFGPETTEVFFTYRYQILNQQISIDIGFAPSDLESIRERHFSGIIIVGLGLVLILVLLIIGLHISRRELEKTNRNLSLKNNLLSSLSHDLSTPLMVLRANLEPLLDQQALPEPKAIKGAAYALEVMEEMVAAVRMLHAQEIGVLKFENEPVDLKHSVDGVLVFVLDQAGQKGVHIKIEDIPYNLYVSAHGPTMMNNVLLNALTNAIKFSPPGGEVRVYAKANESEASLIFEDQGRGFSAHQLEAFQSKKGLSSTSGTQGERGTGLGLLQIRGFMEAYGGRIKLKNLPEKGSQLTLIFKRAKFEKPSDEDGIES